MLSAYNWPLYVKSKLVRDFDYEFGVRRSWFFYLGCMDHGRWGYKCEV
jgi:hypothetical protein